MRQALNMGAAAAGFAHLLGFPAKPGKSAKAAAAAEDDEKDPDAEDEENDPDAEGDDDTKPADGKKAKKAKKAEDEEKDPDAEDEEKDPDAEDEEKDPDAAKAAFRRGRLAERKRCAAIFGSASAGVRPDMAAHLAFSTSMSADEAIPLLEAAAAGGAPTGSRLGQRMAALNTPKPGGDAPAGSAASGGSQASQVAAQIVAAGKKRRGEA